MVSVEEHYESLLSDVYTWLMGGFDEAKRSNLVFFQNRNITPSSSGIAFDLGAGSGFQSIPLAELGFNVTAIDLSPKLLDELRSNSNNKSLVTINDDILNFRDHLSTNCELIVCMTDTITHLKSKNDALTIFQNSFSSLEDGGKLILTFRDLSTELKDTDRFIPVRSDENIIFTCFLEYERETVKIHDIVYIKKNDKWELNKSSYRKIRLSVEWVEKQLSNIGFKIEESSNRNGFQTIVAVKSS
ncbi:class I SAM-dependent methyltransferase [Moritella sp. 24]|uniref:class I SAM-dependent methyltransferase n=1 Tax=Moritella sp. 24 TaxID=2746230 RepID=UPI001BABBAC7|nr:methyltransferase domain-containing protein [Moritella sp. 24]QUM76162.1 class I SAM-dependent methyltransferase [Moritella sp. 24]